MNSTPPFFIIGDIHGYLDNLVRHLRYAGLASSDAKWTGDDAQLWFIGDFTDRGPNGIGVIDYVMRLQEDAARQGGHVGALVGNHDVGILSAYLFPHAPTNGPKGEFYADWIEYGGVPSDLAGLESHHIEWLKNLKAMALVQDRLLIHADALYYLYYGDTIEQVNAATTRLLHGTDTEEWDRLLGFAGERLVFDDRKSDGTLNAQRFLKQYGGKQIIHGHTLISLLSGEPIDRVYRAYTYAKGLVVDVDGGIYRGGSGFVYQVPPLDTANPIATSSQSAK